MDKIKLLKYPIMSVSIVGGLFLADLLLGIDFSRTTKVGPEGIEFDHNTREIASLVTSNLEAQLRDLSQRMEALEGKSDSTLIRSTAKFNEVSDQVSRLSKSQSGITKTVFSGRQGFIYVGQFDSDSGWTRAILMIQNSGQPVKAGPYELAVGGRFRVRSNMVLRDGLPNDDAQYFRGRKNIGVVPRGTLVALLGKPVGIDRKFAVEYWAHVEILE